MLYLEVAQSDLFAEPLPEALRVSLFANRELYLAMANYSTREAVVATTDRYTACSRDESSPSHTWRLAPRSLLVVKRVDQE